jgi:hypothetical protein
MNLQELKETNPEEFNKLQQIAMGMTMMSRKDRRKMQRDIIKKLKTKKHGTN